jgi:hypothetical protein
MATLLIAGFKNECLCTYTPSMSPWDEGFLTLAAAGTTSSSYAHSTISWIGLPDTAKHDILSLRVAARTLSDT